MCCYTGHWCTMSLNSITSLWTKLVEQTNTKYVRIGISVAVGSTLSIYLAAQLVIYKSKHVIPIRVGEEKSKQLTIKQEQINKDIQIGYGEYGNIESQNVVFYLHGFPGSCLDLNAFHQFLFKSVKSDTRVIGIDRPGHGLSSYYDYNCKTCAYDLLKLADKLNIDSFIVTGVSGGAPFVLACAALLPSNRLKCVIPMIGIMPFDRVPNPYKGVVEMWDILHNVGHIIDYVLVYYY